MRQFIAKAISDNNNQMLPLSKLPLPLNEASFRKQGLLKLPKRNILLD